MAERRMFSNKIIGSDAFILLPISTQAAYFHLCMVADDDGFINSAMKTVRGIGASEDDLKRLIEKRFILSFDNGVVVIKHWKMHNQIRKDRYTATQYQEELSQLVLKENKSYTERRDDSQAEDDDNQMAPTWHPNGTQTAPQYSIDKNRLDKDRIDKDRIDKDRVVELLTPTLSQISHYIYSNNLNVDANKFYDYYNQHDWKTTKGNPVDWKKKLHEWSDSERSSKDQTQTMDSNPFLELAKAKGLF